MHVTGYSDDKIGPIHPRGNRLKVHKGQHVIKFLFSMQMGSSEVQYLWIK